MNLTKEQTIAQTLARVAYSDIQLGSDQAIKMAESLDSHKRYTPPANLFSWRQILSTVWRKESTKDFTPAKCKWCGAEFLPYERTADRSDETTCSYDCYLNYYNL